MKPEPVKKRVERGAAWLDKRKPTWWKHIDLDTLAMSSCERCVLGQIYGDFYAVEGTRGVPPDLDGEFTAWAAEHGFTFAFEESSRWTLLRRHWTAEVRERQAAAA